MDEYFTAKELAGLLKVHKTTIYRWVSSGRLKAYVLAGGTLRVHRDDLAEMLSGSIRVAGGKLRAMRPDDTGG